MNNSNQSRRQFLTETGKTGIAIATLPLITRIVPDSFLAVNEYQQQPLPYAFNALEPYIDTKTMDIHFSKHAASYAKNLADACVAEKVDTSNTSLITLLKNISKYSPKMRNNAGGHYNHEMFWQLMKPAPSVFPSGALGDAMNKQFGSFAEFQKVFSDAAITRFGSGWAWLIMKKDGSLAVSSTPNQDNPLMDTSEVQGTPLLGLDVWEHAYYLTYQNKRSEYISKWWSIVNWEFVQKRYAEALSIK